MHSFEPSLKGSYEGMLVGLLLGYWGTSLTLTQFNTDLGSSLVTSLLYVGPRLGHLVGYVWAKKGIQLECVCLGPMLGHFI